MCLPPSLSFNGWFFQNLRVSKCINIMQLLQDMSHTEICVVFETWEHFINGFCLTSRLKNIDCSRIQITSPTLADDWIGFFFGFKFTRPEVKFWARRLSGLTKVVHRFPPFNRVNSILLPRIRQPFTCFPVCFAFFILQVIRHCRS